MIEEIFDKNIIEIKIMRNGAIGAFGASLFNAYIKNLKDKNLEKMTIIFSLNNPHTYI